MIQTENSSLKEKLDENIGIQLQLEDTLKNVENERDDILGKLGDLERKASAYHTEKEEAKDQIKLMEEEVYWFIIFL